MYSIIRAGPAIHNGLITTMTFRTLQAPNEQTGAVSGDFIQAFVIVALVIGLFVLPVAFYILRRPRGPVRSLLLVSTDESARDMVIQAAKRAGYRALVAYRYEDGLEKLRRDMTIDMIVVDDSVPQYEAGFLLAALRHLTLGVHPLIRLHVSSHSSHTPR